MDGLGVAQELRKDLVTGDDGNRIIRYLFGVGDVLGIGFCRPSGAGWTRSTFRTLRYRPSGLGSVIKRVSIHAQQSTVSLSLTTFESKSQSEFGVGAALDL